LHIHSILNTWNVDDIDIIIQKFEIFLYKSSVIDWYQIFLKWLICFFDVIVWFLGLIFLFFIFSLSYGFNQLIFTVKVPRVVFFTLNLVSVSINLIYFFFFLLSLLSLIVLTRYNLHLIRLSLLSINLKFPETWSLSHLRCIEKVIHPGDII